MTPALEAAYAEPHRRYHTRAHIEDCLIELAAVPDLADLERRRLVWAIWWHDAVYDPTRSDNEERSAAMAERDLEGLGVDACDRSEVARLIQLTRGHRVEPNDRLGAVLVSIDLSILGRPAEVYDRYAAAIRQEYGFVPDDAFRIGRAGVLRRFLESEMIFPDARFGARLGSAARENLKRELWVLEEAAACGKAWPARAPVV
jgi:predicted metal-dependent HD superfamily phosphohydrolase